MREPLLHRMRRRAARHGRWLRGHQAAAPAVHARRSIVDEIPAMAAFGDRDSRCRLANRNHEQQMQPAPAVAS